MKTRTKSYELLNSQECNNTILVNCVKNLGRKYGSYLSKSLVLVSIYISMIIGVIKKVLFF